MDKESMQLIEEHSGLKAETLRDASRGLRVQLYDEFSPQNRGATEKNLGYSPNLILNGEREIRGLRDYLTKVLGEDKNDIPRRY